MRQLRSSAIAGVCAAAILSGCQSTQDRSSELSRGAQKITSAVGQTVTHANAKVRVSKSTVLHDRNGTAAVVELQNLSSQTLIKLPIQVKVLDARGTTVFTNNAPGLEPSLTTVAALPQRARGFWVNDQILGVNSAASATAIVGASTGGPVSGLPKLPIVDHKLTDDPTNGTEVVGSVANRSSIPQPKLTVYAVATRGGRVVAAGRGGIPLLAAGPNAKPAHFAIFFIGDPRGAQITLSDPPTALK